MPDIRVPIAFPIGLLQNYHALAGASNPVHIDYDYAHERGLRAPIVHGNLVIILTTQNFFRRVVGHALDSYELKAKFIRPIFAGDAAEIVFSKSLQTDKTTSATWSFSVESDGATAIAGTITTPTLEGNSK